MKQISRISPILLLTLSLLTSCKVRDNTPYNKRTELGLVIYSVTTDKVLSPHLSALDNALKIDEFIKLATQSEKNIFEDRFFPKYKIRFSGDTCKLLPGFATIVMDGNSLKSVGAKWRCSVGELTDIEIKCIGENKWEIKRDMRIDKEISANVLLNITAFEYTHGLLPTISKYFYKVAGSGSYTETSKIYDRDAPNKERNSVANVSFNFANSLDAYIAVNELNSSKLPYFNFKYFNGNLDMLLIMDASSTAEPIKTSLSNNPINPILSITYKNITEEWKLLNQL